MKKNIAYLFLLQFLFLASCAVVKPAKSENNYYQKLSTVDKKLADSLVLLALDYEGIYTISSRLKPMSSVATISFNLANADTSKRGMRDVVDLASTDLQKLKRYQKVVNALQFDDLKFIINPFKINQKNKRIMQISVYRPSLIDSLLNVNQTFFSQFGFVPGTSPEILINTTEYEYKYDRFRAYGYLFGYPEHAVTFFTNASIENDRTKEFVKRDFFQIPVFTKEDGHFVYAIPKGYKTTVADSAIYNRAVYALNNYKNLRNSYLEKDSSVRSYELLKAILKTKQ
jgi:hypothetical protein